MLAANHAVWYYLHKQQVGSAVAVEVTNPDRFLSEISRLDRARQVS